MVGRGALPGVLPSMAAHRSGDLLAMAKLKGWDRLPLRYRVFGPPNCRGCQRVQIRQGAARFPAPGRSMAWEVYDRAAASGTVLNTSCCPEGGGDRNGNALRFRFAPRPPATAGSAACIYELHCGWGFSMGRAAHPGGAPKGQPCWLIDTPALTCAASGSTTLGAVCR